MWKRYVSERCLILADFERFVRIQANNFMKRFTNQTPKIDIFKAQDLFLK